MIISPIIKKIYRYLIKCDFKLVFNNISSHLKTQYTTNTMITNLKRLHKIE